jgi:predicted metal-binding membrane protein
MQDPAAGAVIGTRSAQGRKMFWLGFYAAILLAWMLLIRMMASPLPGISAAEYWASFCIPAADANPITLLAMWGLMSAAMMLPTFVPAIRVFGELGAVKASDARSMAALASGYAIVWLVFAALAAALQFALSKAGAMSGPVQTLAPWLSVGLLLAAGIYQFSPAKEACLAKCRHPLMFFMEHWAPGPGTALAMGARLGAWCVGCCWALMLLGFVGGAMNLLWMGAATLFMTLEKLPEIGRFLTRPLGLFLVGAAALLAARLLFIGG